MKGSPSPLLGGGIGVGVRFPHQPIRSFDAIQV